MDLRKQYNEEPFTQYRIESTVKLTPGGRQFLIDRRIDIIDERQKNINKKDNLLSENLTYSGCEAGRIYYSIESLVAEILLVAEWLSRHNECSAAGEIISISQIVHNTLGELKAHRTLQAIKFWNLDSEELHDKVNKSQFPFTLEGLPTNSDIRMKLFVLNRLRTKVLLTISDLDKDIRQEDEVVRNILQTVSDILCLIIGKYLRSTL